MSLHEIEKDAFRKKLEQQEANALKIRDGMAKLIDDEQKPPEQAAPATTEKVEERFPVSEEEPPAQEEPAPQPAQQQPAPAADARENDPNYWKHRHLTTEGILKAERAKAAKLEAETAALRAEAAKLQADVLDKTRKADAESRNRALEQIALTDFFTAQQIEEYGEQHLKTVMQGVLKAAMQRTRGELDAELERVRGEVDSLRNVAAQTREEAFWSRLSSDVPDWETINQDDAWIAWLSEDDPVSGQTRDSHLKAAQQSLDAKRVAAIFKSFKATQTKPAKPAATKPPVQPVGNPAEASLPSPAQKLRMADWQKFQKEVQQGLWRGREKEAEAIDRKFIAAMQSGNIV